MDANTKASELKSMMGLAPLDVLRMNANTAQKHVAEFLEHEKTCPNCSKDRETRTEEQTKGYQRAALDLNHLLVTKVAGLISMTHAQGQLLATMLEKAPAEIKDKASREIAVGSLAVYSALVPLLIEVSGMTAILAGHDKDEAYKALDIDELLSMIGAQFEKAENLPTVAGLTDKPEAEQAADRELDKLRRATAASSSLN